VPKSSFKEHIDSAGMTGTVEAAARGLIQMSIGTVALSDDSTARVVFTSRDAAVDDVVRALAVEVRTGVVVLNGGTVDFPAEIEARLAPLLAEGLARVVAEDGLTAITGATDAGAFALFGAGLADRSAVSIGVAPAVLVTWPGRDSAAESAAPLERHHTHFVLTEGDKWGDELSMMTRLSALLAGKRPSVMVLVGGGDGARRELAAHVGAGREVIVLGGSGRLADEVAAVVAGGAPGHPAVVAAAATGLITVFDVRRGPEELRALIRSRLQSKQRRSRPKFKRPALLKRFPLPWYRPPPPYPFVKDEDRAAAPLLAAEVTALDEMIAPRFRKLDVESLRAQHLFRFGIVVLIVGSAAATALGSVQAALGGGQLGIGVAEGIVGAVVAGVLVYVRGRRFQQTYFTKRVVAERLKSQYYLFLARSGTYAVDDDKTRAQLLERTLNRIESGDEVE
jgi:hypothetical protein